MKVAVTGHRKEEFEDFIAGQIQDWMDRLVEWLVETHGMDTAITGMATGADTWFAQAAEKSGIAIDVHAPFPQQAAKWSEEDRAEWTRLLGVANRVKFYGDAYDNKYFFARNDGMIAECDVMVAVWNPRKSGGGTYHCFRNFKKTGKPWIWMDPIDGAVALSRDTMFE